MIYIPKLDCSADVPQQDFTRDFTIVIAHRGAALGLWSSIESCEAQLRLTDYRYDYVIVENGGDDDPHLELKTIKQHLRGSGKLLDWITVDRPLSPPDARQMGSEVADGRFLFFADNHVVMAPNYFSSALNTFATTDADMVHSVTRFFCGEQDHLEYKLKLETNFWAEARMVPCVQETRPYRIAAGGHGGFAVKRDVWQKLGGYGPAMLFSGYGGEELTWDLKLAMHGGTNYLDPHMIHHHWSGKRNYGRHYSDDYFRNMMVSAYVIGGQWWIDKVFCHFEHHLKTGPTPMYRLYEEAIQHSFPHKQELERTRSRTLEQQLEQFRELNIPY